MLFHNTYVRRTAAVELPDDAIRPLAEALAVRPVELVLSARGARDRDQLIPDTDRVSAALARRNVRSLLAHSLNGHGANPDELRSALQKALVLAPRDAEDALEDAGIDFNLRYTIFATPDARLHLDGRDLVVEDEREASMHITRRELREQARRIFCGEALARLVAMDIDHIRFAESAIQPLALQIEPGGLMEPDTAARHLRKGDWRSTRRPDFMKDHCVSCGRCFIHCPDNAVIHAMFDREAKDTTGILGIDFDRCTACGLCAAVCPTNRDGYKAIVMVDADTDEVRPERHCVL